MAAALLFAVAVVAAGGSLATVANVDGWYADASKAPWTPPNAVFGPVWTVLYAGLALACFLVWRRGFLGSGQRNRARSWLVGWVVQLALNAAWTPVFFAGLPAVGETAWWIAALIIVLLLAVVLWLILGARRWSRVAAGILFVYALWLAFAATLNLAVIVLN